MHGRHRLQALTAVAQSAAVWSCSRVADDWSACVMVRSLLIWCVCKFCHVRVFLVRFVFVVSACILAVKRASRAACGAHRARG